MKCKYGGEITNAQIEQGAKPVLHTTDKRVRGTTLQNIRKAHFERDPLCVYCRAKGITRLATELDHIKPLHQGGKDIPDNRQGLCAEHHLEKSKLERGHRYNPRVSVGIDGYPVNTNN